ncbi:MAG TPA: KpsF/GutQ family sugar-phosphate isomerase [Phycisphaerae bacterium]|nr:KpsF/GutQ family sugar-phosphate isomerase [Phycisphaerae bacterium]
MRDPVELARDFLGEQAGAIARLAGMVSDSFDCAIGLILASTQQMVVTGIGKSGLIARKAAATLASTGTPAMFMHPVEGVHGDLGAVGPGAVLLALSKSGHTEELVKFVSHFRRIGGRVIVICEDQCSPLGELADVVLPIPAMKEAGPLGLAPTTSTLLSLAMCDALAMALLDARGFGEADFARYHPDGSLGRRLLLRAGDLMHGGKELPVVKESATFNEMLIVMMSHRLGMTCVIAKDGSLRGVFTDGDLRRLLTRCETPAKLTAGQAWQQSRRAPSDIAVKCSTITPQTPAVECLRLMRESEITVLVVSETGREPMGIIRLQDIVRAGIG